MARFLISPLDGANPYRIGAKNNGYGGLVLVGMIIASLAILSMIIFACGNSQGYEGSSKKGKRDRFLVYYNNYGSDGGHGSRGGHDESCDGGGGGGGSSSYHGGGCGGG